MDPKTGEERPVTISVDDGIRPNANMIDLAKLKPAFKLDGTTTAGIFTQLSSILLLDHDSIFIYQNSRLFVF